MTRPVKLKIHPEFSAQRRSHPPNPGLELALHFVKDVRPEINGWGRVADLGCGKLRHYDIMRSHSAELYLVDTEEQLSAIHSDCGAEYCVYQEGAKARKHGKKVHVVTENEFASTKLNLDLIVCVAVLDVVLARTRSRIIKSAARNLNRSGFLVLIVPRNDTTILDRCTPENSYQDGHVFFHHGVHTFYRNFRDHSPIVKAAKSAGLTVAKDLSRYRQVCLIFGAT